MLRETGARTGSSFSELIEAWPADGLEAVDACPVCGEQGRELLYDGLTDRVFFCAPGVWTLYRCKGCGSGYLDPRPTRESVGLAYRSYFTHQAPSPAAQPLTLLRRLKAGLRNDYLRYRYGVSLGRAVPLGRIAVYLAVHRRLNIDRANRHLPRAAPGARLLDVGCGNGQFLLTAGALGWEAWGIEPDPHAVAAARSAGLRVEQGGLPETGMPDAYFDVVTMDHVLEHLHDPVAALREVRRILKPRGILWIATPNLDSLGSRRFGPHWRGLEPPRHLVLLTPSSLELVCVRAGLSRPTARRTLSARFMFCASSRISRGIPPFDASADSGGGHWRWMAWVSDLLALVWPRVGDELVAVARA